jgi:hypothetical protein
MDRPRVTTLLDEVAVVARLLRVAQEPVLLPTQSLRQLAEVGLARACMTGSPNCTARDGYAGRSSP